MTIISRLSVILDDFDKQIKASNYTRSPYYKLPTLWQKQNREMENIIEKLRRLLSDLEGPISHEGEES